MSDEKEPEATPTRTSMTYSEYVKRFRKKEFQTVTNLIGELLVQFQNLESALRSGVSYFVNPDDDVYGAIVTEKLSFKFLARAFLNLLEYHTAKNKITIDWELAEKVVAQCNDCDEKRNGIVHALYYPTEAGPTRYKSNWRPGKEPAQPVPMSEADLRDLISKTVSTRFALSALFYWYLPNDKPESNFPKGNEESDSTPSSCLQ